MAGTAPAWKNLKGMRRVQAEFKHLSADIAAKKFDFIKELSLAEDNMLVWQLKLHNFDNDLPGGKQLNQDLRRLHGMYGQDHILMQIEFPKDYPHQPFFVRVVSPRCQMYTGHVTAGGSICLEALTCSGTSGSWQPDFSVESLLNVIIINMIDCPVTLVQTATGPGGRSGPLRIDFSCSNPTRGYSSAEARQAFHRTLENHKRMGWGGPGNAAAPSAAAGPGVLSAAAAAVAAARVPGMHMIGGQQPLGGGNAGSRAAAFPTAAAAAAYAGRGSSRPKRGAAAVVSDGGDDGAAAAAAVPNAADGQPVHKQRQRVTRAGAVAAPAALSTACDVIDLLDSNDDHGSDADLAAAVAASAQETSKRQLQPAAAAADTPAAGPSSRLKIILKGALVPSQLQQQGPDRAAAAAAADGTDDGGAATLRVKQAASVLAAVAAVPAPAAAAAVPAAGSDGDSSLHAVVQQPPQQPSRHQQQRQQVMLLDSQDSDVEVTLIHCQQPTWQGAVRTAAAAARGASDGNAIAAAGTGNGTTTSGRKQSRHSLDAVLIDSRDDDDVVILSDDGNLNAAAAGAAAAACRPRRQATQQAQQQQQQARPKRAKAQPKQRAPQQQQQQVQQAAVVPLAGQPTVQQQVVVVDGGAAPRVQLELGYPSHCDYSQPIQSNTVRLVDLPLNGQQQRVAPSDPLEAAAAAAQLSQSDLDMLLSQGLTREDALAALLMAEGDVDEALLRAVTCAELGGTAKLWRGEQPVEVVDVNQQHRQQEQARRIAEEVEMVLAHIDATGGGVVSRSKVLMIERVQHARLWKRYCLKRSELLEVHGEAGLNERLLFHGTSPGTADTIAQSGFDFRLVSYASAYGNGLYFADHSSTAWGYCQKPDSAAAAAAATGMVVPGGWVAGAPPMPGTVGMPGPAGVLASMKAAMGFGGGVAPTNMVAAPAAAVPQGRSGKRGRYAKVAAAAYAAATPAQRVYKMIVARVALGQQTQGVHGMRKPPAGYDSVNSGTTQAPGNSQRHGRHGQALYYCHVIFDNDQCFPEYLVTLRA